METWVIRCIRKFYGDRFKVWEIVKTHDIVSYCIDLLNNCKDIEEYSFYEFSEECFKYIELTAKRISSNMYFEKL